MNWMVFAGLVLASLAVMLLGLRALVWLRGKEHAPARKFQWASFHNDFTEPDAMVAYADRMWPYILGDKERGIPMSGMLIPAILTSSILVAFGAASAIVIANGNLLMLVLLLMVSPLANLVQAYHATRPEPLTRSLSVFLVVIAIASAAYSFFGSSIVGNVADTQANISAGSTNAKLRRRDQLAKSLEEIRARRASAGNLPLATLEAQEKAARDQQICESWLGRGVRVCPQDKVDAREAGPKCGPKCQEHKAEADRLAAMVADANAERTQQAALTAINAELKEAGFVRTEAAPVAFLGGSLHLGIIMVIVAGVVAFFDVHNWISLGQEARQARKIGQRKAREDGNLLLANLGHSPRYRIDDDEVDRAALPAPDKAVGDSVTISVEADPMKTIEASESLSEIHTLFVEALRADPDRAVTFATLRQVYEVRAAAAGRTRIMNRMTFNQELRRYLELRSIPHASAKIQGYRLGVDSQPAQEAAE